jgi:hypothetical protein
MKKKKKKATTEQTPQLFDKLVKRILRLSSRAVIYCINGLYHSSYPLECPVDYPNPVSVSPDLKERRADMLIRIMYNGPHTYHLEIQTDDALNIVVRMFEYGAAYGIGMAGRELPVGVTKKSDAVWVINFPTPLLLRWDTSDTSPDILTLDVRFGETDTGTHCYKVPVFKLLKHSVEELEAQGLLILLPFCVLKLRERVKEAQPTEERQALAGQMRSLVEELLAALERGEQAGYLLSSDIPDILDSTDRLLRELYHPYTEFTEVRQMVQGVYELRTDKLRKELATAQQNAEKAERNTKKAERNMKKAERNAEKAERNAEKAERNAEKAQQGIKVAQQTLQNLEQLGVSRELIEQARKMQETSSSS